MSRPLVCTCLALVALSIISACLKSETTPAEGEAGAEADAASVACPFPATECPLDHCREVRGFALDEDAGCMREAVFGCTKEPGSTTDAPCFERLADGTLVTGSSSDLRGRPEFARCTAEESARIAVSPCD